MNFQEALEHALNGDALLFTGAGFSMGAINSRGEQMKGGAGLAKHLSAKLAPRANSESSELQDVAEEYSDRFGHAELEKELLGQFRAAQVGTPHRTIARVPWRRVYTTNYDTVYELASSLEGRAARAVTLSERPSHIPAGDLAIIYLNGYVERMTGAAGDEIRLTDSSYITSSVSSSPWSAAFRQDLAIAKAVFFVGYSIGDLDISRLFGPTVVLSEKTFFVVGPSPTTRTVNRALKFGTVQQFDTSWLARQIDLKRQQYQPTARLEPLWFCLEPYSIPNADSTVVSDKAVFDLFALGRVDRQLLWNSLEEVSQPYVVQRTLAKIVLQCCKDTSKVVAAHGALGNGKSLLLEMSKWMAAKEGITVYSLVRRSPSLKPELEYLAATSERFLLVIDNYPAWRDAIEFIGRRRNDSMSVLVAARTSVHDASVEQLEEDFEQRSVHEISADLLGKEDLGSISNLLAHYGLWGDRASLSADARLRVLMKGGRNEWHSILLELFQSPEIKRRMANVVGLLNNKKGFYEILAGVLALTVLNVRPNLDLLIDLFGDRILDRAVQQDLVLQEFVDFDSGEVSCRSAIAAKFMLGQVLDPNIVSDVLVSLAKSLDKYAGVSTQYNEILRSLVQFSQLESVLPNRSLPERRAAVFGYYERVKDLSYCKRNPQFWLQYAIAAMIFENVDRSEIPAVRVLFRSRKSGL